MADVKKYATKTVKGGVLVINKATHKPVVLVEDTVAKTMSPFEVKRLAANVEFGIQGIADVKVRITANKHEDLVFRAERAGVHVQAPVAPHKPEWFSGAARVAALTARSLTDPSMPLSQKRQQNALLADAYAVDVVGRRAAK